MITQEAPVKSMTDPPSSVLCIHYRAVNGRENDYYLWKKDVPGGRTKWHWRVDSHTGICNDAQDATDQAREFITSGGIPPLVN